MAYGNWGSFVYCNGTHREDKEDCVLFENTKATSWADYCHGVMGDGNLRVKCYKSYPPEIFEFDIHFEYNGYIFDFVSGEPCSATMREPDGTVWQCNYGYEYGAGWMDVESND